MRLKIAVLTIFLAVILLILLIPSALTISQSSFSDDSFSDDSLSADSFSELLPITLDKQNYVAEETVEISINIDPSDYAFYELIISDNNQSYTYRGDFNPLMFFYPTNQGIYTIALVEKSSRATYYSVSFNVSPKIGAVQEPISTGGAVASQAGAGLGTEEVETGIGLISSDNDSLSMVPRRIFAAKKQYARGEQVRVIIQYPDESGISFYHSFNGVEKKYMGDLREIVFVPVGIGYHYLILKDSADDILDEFQFEVLQQQSLENISSGEPLGENNLSNLISGQGLNQDMDESQFNQEKQKTGADWKEECLGGNCVKSYFSKRKFYQKDGVWNEINTTIEKTFGNYDWKAEKNNFKFYVKSNKVMLTGDDNAEIGFEVPATGAPKAVGNVITYDLSRNFSSAGNDYFVNAMLTLTLFDDRVEKLIIINNLSLPSDFEYEENLSDELQKNKFTIGDLSIWDSSCLDDSCIKNYYPTKWDYEGNSIKLKINKTWLDNAVFPIIIDPTVYYNYSNSTNNKAYKYGGATSLAGTNPTWAEGWRAATEATAAEYTNLSTPAAGLAKIIAAGGNYDPFWRFEFTVNEPVVLINWVYVKFRGYEDAAEAGYCYMANWSAVSWSWRQTLPTSNGNLTWNDTVASRTINSTNGKVSLFCYGNAFDNSGGDEVWADFVEMRVDYTPDTTPPEVNINTSLDNIITTDTTPPIDFNFTDSKSSTANCTLYFNGNPYNRTNDVDNNTPTFMIANNSLPDANYSVYINCTDIFNNTGQSSIIRFVVDATAPTVNATSPLNNNFTNNNTPAFVFNFTDSISSTANCTLFVGSTVYGINSSTLNHTQTSITATSAIPDGAYTWNVTCVDFIGNRAGSSARNITIDTQAPNINSVSPENDDWSPSAAPTFQFYFTDSLSSLANCTLYIDDEFQGNNASTRNNTPTNITSSALGEGSHSWYVNCTDNTMNIGTSSASARVINIDTIYPVVNLSWPESADFINDNTVQFNYTPSDANLESCVLYGNFTGTFGPNETDLVPTSDIVNSFSPLSLTEGNYSWNVWCNDSVSHSNFSSQNFTFSIDLNSPEIHAFNVNGTSFRAVSYACLNATVNDSFSGVQTVYAEIINPNLITANYTLTDDGTGCDAVPGDHVYSRAHFLQFVGNYTWLQTHAQDTAGNWQSNNTNLNWNASSSGSMTVDMLSPAADMEINESDYNYEYQQTCNASCDVGGDNCENVFLFAQYQPIDNFLRINTTSIDLINDENNFSCGTMAAGGASCAHTFNITSGANSGNNTWLIRCYALSSNIGAFISSTISLTINDHPFANFSYPENNSWFGLFEMLNASNSFDSDGSIVNYLFDYDNNTAFTSPRTICNGASNNCTWNISEQQDQCENNSLSCYLRVNVTDDNGLTNSTYVIIGFDKTGPITTLDQPQNFSAISGAANLVNATAVDLESANVSTITFEYRPNNTADWQFICTEDRGPVYDCEWDSSVLLDGNTYEVRAWANDSRSNNGLYDVHTNITVDNNIPLLELVSPSDYYRDTDGNLIFTYRVSDVSNITNCSLIINNTLNQTNVTVQKDIDQFFYVDGVTDGTRINWSINCTDIFGFRNASEVRHLNVTLAQGMNVNVSVDKIGYSTGEPVSITTNVTDSFGSGINADITTDVVMVFNKSEKVASWWNTSWKMRKPVYISSKPGANLTNVTVRVNITGLAGNITDCVNEIRVASVYNQGTPVNILSGDDSTFCDIVFLANVSANASGQNNYFVYYNNSGAVNPGYGTLPDYAYALLSENFDGAGWTLDTDANPSTECAGGSGSFNNCVNLASSTDFAASNFSSLGAHLHISDPYTLVMDQWSPWAADRGIFYSFNATNACGGDVCSDARVTAYVATGSTDNNAEFCRMWARNTSGTSYVTLFNCGGAAPACEFDGTGNVAPSLLSHYQFVNTTLTSSLGLGLTNYTAVHIGGNVSGTTDECFYDDVIITGLRNQAPNITATSVGSPQKWIMKNSAQADANGIGIWDWSSSGQVAGNYSAVSFASGSGYNDAYNYTFLELFIDVSAPTVKLMQPVNNNYTTGLNINFSFNVSDDGTIANCSLMINGSKVNTTFEPAEDVSINLSYTLSQGTYNWSVNCTDYSGKENNSETRNITIDLAGPVSILDRPLQDNLINTQISGYTYKVNATLSDAGIGLISKVTFMYRYNSTDTWKLICADTDGIAPFECNWDLTGFQNGEDYEVLVYANDTLGNTGDNDTHTNITIIAEYVNITSIIVDDDLTIPLDQIGLNSGATKTVYCNMTVKAPEIYTDILGVNATLFSSTSTLDAVDSNRTHYSNSSCTFLTGGGDTADYQCVFNLWHFAINGTWNCTSFTRDAYTNDDNSDNTTVNQLFALNVSTSVIDYANLEPNSTSANVTVNISNAGNMPMNISVYGFGGDNEAIGAGLSMICQINNISVTFQKFSTNTSADYDSKTTLSSTPLDIGLTIPAKSTFEEVRVNSTYWQFMVPPESHTYGQCNGSVIFMAETP